MVENCRTTTIATTPRSQTCALFRSHRPAPCRDHDERPAERTRADLTLELEIRAIARRRATLRNLLANAQALGRASQPGSPDHDEARKRIARLQRDLTLLNEGMRIARRYKTKNEILLRLLKRHSGRSSHARSVWRQFVLEAQQRHRTQDCETILEELYALFGYGSGDPA